MTERKLLPPDHPQAPKYWMNETGGLVPAIKRYLKGLAPDADDVNLIRAYLRQWIDSPVWDVGDAAARTKLDELRRTVRQIGSRLAIDQSIDPL
jgi:hypothetical protein